MKDILLFQPYLRAHILNFAKATTKFRFVVKSDRFATTKNFYKKSMLSPKAEFSRSKLGWQNRLRRILGILNVRIKFTNEADFLFTYGTLLITNKPYFVYVENGAALFNYDPTILRNPLAKLFFSILIRLPQCKKIVFMSETAHKSLLATGKFSSRTVSILEKKSAQVYPYVNKTLATPKEFQKNLKLLFTGIFYAKGGQQLINAFEHIRNQHDTVSLTLITPLHMLLPEDHERIRSISGITLLDAALSPEEMQVMYKTHDIFLFPTFRDTFGLVLIESLSFGLPIIATEQYATQEMVINSYNGFLFHSHPVLDYDPETKEMYGRLYDAKDFYHAIFEAENTGEMKSLEQFIENSVLSFLNNPEQLKLFSENSLSLFQEKFHPDIVSKKIEKVFLTK